ncbi:MAG: acyl carrier protein [Myxococcaceae bacterium]
MRKIVIDTLVSEFELEREKIVPTARLREDLGLDSLDGVDLIVALEKALSVQIPETDARQIRTVQDIYQFIEKTAAQMAGGGAPAAAAPAASEPPKA